MAAEAANSLRKTVDLRQGLGRDRHKRGGGFRRTMAARRSGECAPGLTSDRASPEVSFRVAHVGPGVDRAHRRRSRCECRGFAPARASSIPAGACTDSPAVVTSASLPPVLFGSFTPPYQPALRGLLRRPMHGQRCLAARSTVLLMAPLGPARLKDEGP